MNPAEAASRICDDLVRRVAERGARQFLISRFSYPDGDSIVAYINSLPDGTSEFTDLGTTSFKLRTAGVQMSDRRTSLVRQAAALSELEWRNGAIVRRIGSAESVGTDFVRYCECAIRISNLEFEESARVSSALPDQVEYLIRKRVSRPAHRHWYPDPDSKLYPVDYHFNSTHPPVNVFVVTSPVKALLTTASVMYYNSEGLVIPTLSIVEPGMHGRNISRLERTCDRIVFGVSQNEDRIVDFIQPEADV